MILSNKFTMRVCFLLYICSVFSGAVLSAESAGTGVSRLAFVGEWLVLGPLDNSVVDGVCTGFTKDFLGTEAAARPKANQLDAGLRWKSWQSSDGGINLLQATAQAQDAVAYAYHEFTVSEAGAAVLKIGSDDGIRLWFNGELVLDHHIHRALAADEDAMVVQLRAGTNRVLVKVDQGSGDWGFLLHLISPATERESLRLHPPTSLQISVDTVKTDSASTISGSVQTVPAHVLTDAITVQLKSEAGKTLAESRCVPGVRFSLPLPAGLQGPVTIVAQGSGSLAALSAETRIWAGNSTAMATKLAAQARVRAEKELTALISNPAKQDPVARLVASVPGASLQFLADQIEGKGHPSLQNPERRLRALFELYELMGKAPATRVLRPGLHQYAYLSPVDDSVQPFTLWLPPRDTAKRLGLIVSLHGYSGNDWDSAAGPAAARPLDFAIVGAFGRGDLGYHAMGERDVLDVIDLVSSACAIDPDRMVITGISMGGMGTWRFGQMYASRFAGIAPFCGWTVNDWLPNLRNTPALVVHGDADPVVPPQPDRRAVAWLRDENYPVRYDEVPGAGHNVWTPWIADGGAQKLINWARTLKRNPWPDHITITAKHLRYGSGSWARIVQLAKPAEPGTLDLKIIDERHLTIRASALDAFAIDLAHPRLARTGRILLAINGSQIPVDAGKRTTTLIRDAKDRFKEEIALRRAGTPPKNATQSAAAGQVFHDGGGLADLFYRPVYLVYGTLPRDGGVQLKAQAMLLADWSLQAGQQAGTKTGQLRVIADTALTPAMIASASLLLVGSPAENRVTARVITGSVLRFAGDTVSGPGFSQKQPGVMAIMPNPENPQELVGILSLPFNLKDSESICSRLNATLRRYGTSNDDIASFILPDIVLFDRTIAPLWTGYYDRNWKLLPGLAP